MIWKNYTAISRLIRPTVCFAVREILEAAAFSGDFRPVRPEDDKRSASDDRQVTKRSAESVPPVRWTIATDGVLAPIFHNAMLIVGLVFANLRIRSWLR